MPIGFSRIGTKEGARYERTMKIYIIREKTFGHTFQRTGRQGSFQIPTVGTKFRFWCSVGSSRSWLTTWCKGEQHWGKVSGTDYEGFKEVDFKFLGFENSRDRENYEIVECELTVGEPIEDKKI